MTDAEALDRLTPEDRLAFAVRCATLCLPLVRRLWPTIAADHYARLTQTLTAAHSKTGDLHTHALHAAVCAGAALSVSTAASLAIKPIQFAAQAAANPLASADAALRAYHFALRAAWEANDQTLEAALNATMAKLQNG